MNLRREEDIKRKTTFDGDLTNKGDHKSRLYGAKMVMGKGDKRDNYMEQGERNGIYFIAFICYFFPFIAKKEETYLQLDVPKIIVLSWDKKQSLLVFRKQTL